MQPQNDPNRIKLRRYENRLAISGMAVIAFGLWSIVKALAYFLTQSYDVIDAFGLEDDSHSLEEGLKVADLHSAFSGVLIGIIFTVLVFELLVRVYVGRSAFLDGRELKKKSPVYIILSFLIALLLILSLVNRAVTGIEGAATDRSEVMDTAVVSNLLDITSLLALAEMVISGIRVRRLRKQLGVKVVNVKKQERKEKKEKKKEAKKEAEENKKDAAGKAADPDGKEMEV